MESSSRKRVCAACGYDRLDTHVHYGYGWKQPQTVLICYHCHKAERTYHDDD